MEDLQLSEGASTQAEEQASSTELSPRSKKLQIMQQAYEMKEQGNALYKEGDYKRALAKYARVQCYTNAILPSSDQQVSMFTQMSKKMQQMNTDKDETHALQELLATTYLNMAQCFFQTGQYQKSVEKATLSLGIKREQPKALFRRAQANSQRKDYEGAAQDLEEALVLLTNAGQGECEMAKTVRAELEQVRAKGKEYDKAVQKKMGGFLTRE
ncbi:hypothetical protein FGO68_gene7490 [Halteria grandinella]|uniref:Tetratricopeptide repeat protein n=1 Tax=Halteria grandinella TaxID=5974 RepID=A0A8J8NID8_HALGN|nr:hypothetical protein FGO68_gene7490 [Halteria grandinella]